MTPMYILDIEIRLNCEIVLQAETQLHVVLFYFFKDSPLGTKFKHLYYSR